jgi:hypothetical protein
MFSAALSAVQVPYYSPQIYSMWGSWRTVRRHSVYDKVQSLQKCFLTRKKWGGGGGGAQIDKGTMPQIPWAGNFEDAEIFDCVL